MPTVVRRHTPPPAAPPVRLCDEMLTEESVRAIPRLPEGPGRHRVMLDLGGVRIPTAGGLGALVTLHQRLRAGGGTLTLLNVRPWVYEVFELMRLTEVLDVRAA